MAIAILNEESLKCQYKGYKDIILFATTIMREQVCNPEEQHLHYNIKKWKDRAVLIFFVASLKCCLGAVNRKCW